MNQDQIIRMAWELGNSIAGCREWQEVMRTRDNVRQDPEAWDLLLEYQEIRGMILEKEKRGENLTELDDLQLKSTEEGLKSNTLILQMIEAQEKFDNLMRAVYFTLNQGISGQTGCGGGCSSCGGGCE